MNYLETLLQSAQEEAKRLQEEVRTLRETLYHKVKTAADYRFPVEYVKPKPLETKELEVRLQRLAAHLTKRAKENTKRAEKLDFEVKNTFMCHGESEKKSNSAYYHSGKADTYLRAAGKVLETIALHINVAAPTPANPEKWVVECRNPEGEEWLNSAYNGIEPFSTKGEAEGSYAQKSASNLLEYRARRIDVSEKWVVEMTDDNNWERSSNCPKVYDTKEEAEQAIVEHGSKSLKYRIVKENQ